MSRTDGLAYGVRPERLPGEPCGACSGCLKNQLTAEEVRLQRQGGGEIEVLGGPWPCLRPVGEEKKLRQIS